MPDQNEENDFFTPPVPALVDGCTDYTQSELSTDLSNGGTVRNPIDLDNVTHANALGGFDIRRSFLAAVGIGFFSAFFNIKAYAPLDYFDTFRFAQLSGAIEKRSISWGTPWFPSWENACNPNINPSAIMPMPTADEMATAMKEAGSFGSYHKIKHKVMRLLGSTVPFIGWHNHKLDGWTTPTGVPLYRDKSLQGNTIGVKGFIFFTREVINTVMTIPGTVAFTGTLMGISNPVPVSTTFIQWIVSIMRNLSPFRY